MKTAAVIAVYNGEKWLREQLESIAGQTLHPDEILIRDDQSSDRSLEVAEQFKKDHPELKVKILHAAGNGGYKENFRQLLKAADADWIFLSDQDDFWQPDKMEKMIEMTRQHPEIQVLCSSFSFMNADSVPYEVQPKPGWSNNNLYPHPVQADACVPVCFDELVFHNFFQGCSMMVSRQIRDEVIGHWDGRIAHDWLIALMAARNRGLYFYNRPLFHYRIHSSNTTGMIQGEKVGLLRKLSNVGSRHYRTIVKKDSLNVLHVIRDSIPGSWNEARQKELEFFEASLQGVENKNTGQIWKLRSSPLYRLSAGRTGWLADFVYTLMPEKEDHA